MSKKLIINRITQKLNTFGSMLHKYNKISNKDDKILIRGTIVNNLLLRSPCKILETYDNPLQDFSNGGAKKKKENT